MCHHNKSLISLLKCKANNKANQNIWRVIVKKNHNQSILSSHIIKYAKNLFYKMEKSLDSGFYN